MWFFLLNIAMSVWVFTDARRRKDAHPLAWAIGTCLSLLMIVVVPFYFARRPLLATEVREGGMGWNVARSFALLWTVVMWVAIIGGAGAAGETMASAQSGADRAGAAIGTALGVGTLITLWLFVLVGTIVVGLLLKKSSVVERG